jgi:hypothetical protein
MGAEHVAARQDEPSNRRKALELAYSRVCDGYKRITNVWVRLLKLLPLARAASKKPPCNKPDVVKIQAIEGPVSRPWREGTLTRATELEALKAWVLGNHCPPENTQGLVEAIEVHLMAARQAALGEKPSRKSKQPKQSERSKRSKSRRWFRNASLIERAMSNLDAAEVEILNFAPPSYLLGQMPGMLNHVQRHLPPTDPRRQEFERIAQRVGVKDPDHPLVEKAKESKSAETKELILVERITRILFVERLTQAEKIIKQERGKIVTVVRGASSEALREQLRLRSFRNILICTIVGLTLLAVGVAVFGFLWPTRVPLCFQPSLESGESVIVCPTGYSDRLPADEPPGPLLNDRIAQAAKRSDDFTVELVGLTAAAVVATARIRNIHGSSEAPELPVLLALLKLPMGAITAFLGLLLIRGQFIPGLSALDTPAQILSWALVFGFAQQLFTRMVDQQGQIVLNSIRPADKPSEPSPRRP